MTSNTGTIFVFSRTQHFGSDDFSSLGKTRACHRGHGLRGVLELEPRMHGGQSARFDVRPVEVSTPARTRSGEVTGGAQGRCQGKVSLPTLHHLYFLCSSCTAVPTTLPVIVRSRPGMVETGRGRGDSAGQARAGQGRPGQARAVVKFPRTSFFKLFQLSKTFLNWENSHTLFIT